MVSPSAFTPDVYLVEALIDRVASLSASPRNCFAGHVRPYDVANGTPKDAVFVTASGGSLSRPIKGSVLGETIERRGTCPVMIRNRSFPVGQTLARQVFEALHYNPPPLFIETSCTNGQPSFVGVTDDGLFEWAVFVDFILDVVR